MSILRRLKDLRSTEATEKNPLKRFRMRYSKNGGPRALSSTLCSVSTSDTSQTGSVLITPQCTQTATRCQKSVAPDYVDCGLFIGPYSSCNLQVCAERNITRIVNCSREVRLLEWVDFNHLSSNGILVEHVNWRDDNNQVVFPSPELDRAFQFIDDGLAAGGQVLVNCSQGVSRSTTLLCAYLISRKGFTFDDAVLVCRKARPVANPNDNFKLQLHHLEKHVKACKTARKENKPEPAAHPCVIKANKKASDQHRELFA